MTQPATPTSTPNRRQGLQFLLASPFFLSSCEAKPMQGEFEVVLFSYLDRPIFDVLLSGFDIGVAGAWAGNMSGGGSMSGVSVKYGPQTVSWRFADSGETVNAKNKPLLEKPPADHRYLCVHVYPDGTVELLTSLHFPDKTARGVAMGDAARKGQGR